MKIIKLTKKDLIILKKQKEAFKKKFGREPGHYDPIFFDPDYDFPIPITTEKLMDQIVEASTKEGIDSYRALKHFQFTDKEIEEYFNNIRHRANI